MRRTLVALAIVLLALVAGAVWVIRSGAAAESVRARVIDEATRALGREVRVERLAGDPWRGIVLQGVRIAGPTPGARAFFEARRVVLSFDVGRLVRDLIGGRGVIASLTRVDLERPALLLARGDSGRWNYADLLARQRGVTPTPPSFRALVEVREGTLAFRDALRLPQRVGPNPPSPFAAHFDRISGTLDFGSTPLVGLVLDAVNVDGRTPALVHVSGRAALGEATFDLDLAAHGGSAAFWGPYLIRLPWVVWGGGTFDSTMHLLASRWGRQIVLDYRGHLMMRDGRALLLPRRTLLSDIDGPLTVDNLSVTTSGLTMAVDASPVSVRGTVTHQGGVSMDLVLRSGAIDLRTLQELLFPRAQVRLSGRARGEVRITGSFGAPSVEGKIDRASGSIDRQGFADLSGRFQYYGGVLTFDDLAASAGGGRLSGHLRLDVRAGTFFMLADARGVDTHVLDGVGLTITPTFSGAATGIVAAARTPDGLLAQGRLTVGQGRAFGVGFDRADAVVGYDRGLVEVDRFEARSGATRLHGFGEVSRGGALDLAVSGLDVNLRTVGERFGLQRWIAGTADVHGRLIGTLRSPELDGTVRGRDGRLGPLPFEVARGRIRLTNTTLQTPGLLLFEGAGRYFASGLIRWAEPSRIDLTARAADVAAQRLIDIADVPLRMSGTVATTVRLGGSIHRPMAQGVVELRAGQIEGQPVDQATAAFRWTGAQLLVESFRAGVNGSTLQASGTITRSGRVGITFSARELDLKDIVALRRDALRLAGTVDLTGSIRGTLGAPVFNAAAASDSLVVNGQQFDQASGQVGYRRGRLTLAPLVLQQKNGAFRLSGTVRLQDDPVLDLRISASQAELATLLGLGRVRSRIALRGTVDGEVAASGPVSNPRASLNVRISEARLGDHAIQEAVVRADLANQAVNLESLRLLPARGELVGAGLINLRGRSEVEFGGTGLDLDLLRPLFNLQRPLRGSLDFTLQLTGELNDPLVGLSASAADGGIGSMSFDRMTLQAFYRSGQFNVENGVLQKERHRVQITGTVPFNPARMRLDDARPVNLRLELPDSDLSLLGLFTDRIEQAQGRLVGAVSITGTATRPHLEGQVTAAGGTVRVRGLEPAFTELQAQISFNENDLHVDSFRARAGEGTVSLTGAAGFLRFRPDWMDFTLSADGARLGLPGLFSGRVDGGVRACRPSQLDPEKKCPGAREADTSPRLQISGTATLSNGDIVVSAAQRIPARPANGASGPGLDVEVRGGDALWVNVGGLRFQVRGVVHAGGTVRAPTLSGEVAAERGSFIAFNTPFRLLEGGATFTGARGMTPFIDAVAETRVSVRQGGSFVPALVRLHVTGTPEEIARNPERALQLSSDPPFPRNEIIAALGRQRGFAALLSGGSADLEVALVNELSNALFGRAVARALGLEEFTLEYDSERPLTLRVGKLLIENLYLTLTSELGAPQTGTLRPRTVWALEYRLSPTTMLAFSVDNSARYRFLYSVTYRY